MNDTERLIRTVITEYYKRTDEVLTKMADSITELSNAIQVSAQQLARYDERQTAQADRLDRMERTQSEQTKKLDDLRDRLAPDVVHNSIIRKAALWLVSILVAGCLGGGIAFIWWLLRTKIS